MEGFEQFIRKTTCSIHSQCSASNIGCVFADVVSDQQRAPELCLPQGPVGPKGFTSFSSVSIGCVRKLLGSLDTSKATGSDGIPSLTVILNINVKEEASKSAQDFRRNAGIPSLPVALLVSKEPNSLRIQPIDTELNDVKPLGPTGPCGRHSSGARC